MLQQKLCSPCSLFQRLVKKNSWYSHGNTINKKNILSTISTSRTSVLSRPIVLTKLTNKRRQLVIHLSNQKPELTAVIYQAFCNKIIELQNINYIKFVFSKNGSKKVHYVDNAFVFLPKKKNTESRTFICYWYYIYLEWYYMYNMILLLISSVKYLKNFSTAAE